MRAQRLHGRATGLGRWARWVAAVLATCVVAAVGASQAFASALTFNTAISTSLHAAFNFPVYGAAGDFNGDGNLDIIATDGSQPAVHRLMLGNGHGSFTEHNVADAGVHLNSNRVVAADLNGDGRLDFVVTNNNSSDTSVFLNTGNDGSGVPQFTTGHYGPFAGRSLAVGALTPGGALDFVAGNSCGQAQAFLNDGTGSFAAAPGGAFVVTPGCPSLAGSAIVDLNGDGNGDYVVADVTGRTTIFWGNGDGSFQSARTVLATPYGQDMKVGDVNGDGRPDIVETDPNFGVVLVILNTGGGTFAAPVPYPAGGAGSASPVIADFDGDGTVDVALSDSNSNKVAVLHGNGDGTFGPAATFSSGGQANRQLVFGDFDNDGQADIATVNSTSRDVTVLLNTTPPSDTTPPVITPTVTGTVGQNGWYTSDVSVHWDVVDAESAVSSTSGCDDATVSSDTAGITFECSATSAGGPSTNRVTIMRDATLPTIAYTGNAGSYTVDQDVSIACASSDSLSGIASDTCAGASGSAWSLGLGEHSLSATATDNAGNVGSGTTTFTVTADATSLCNLVTRWAKNAGQANSLCVKLRAAEAAAARGNEKTKENNINAFDNEVRAQTGKGFTAAQAALLVEFAAAL